MSEFEDCINRLRIERLDNLLFRGRPNDWPNRHVFGGHVVAQALKAASQTVAENYSLHSMHCYFLRPGIAGQDIIYDVDPIRNGRSFCTRRVNAIQNGEAIFSISQSFHIREEGLYHQPDMPDVLPPEDLIDDMAFFRRIQKAFDKDYDPAKQSYLPFETRSLDPMNLETREAKGSSTGYWFTLKQPLTCSDASRISLLAYISDMMFLSSTLRPHGIVPRDGRLKNMASLDHSLWLHDTDFDLNDWLFFQTEGDWAGYARGLARGTIFSRDGRLIASTCQEGLIRLRKED